MIVDSIIHYNRGSHYDIHQDANTVIIMREYVIFLMSFLSIAAKSGTFSTHTCMHD